MSFELGNAVMRICDEVVSSTFPTPVITIEFIFIKPVFIGDTIYTIRTNIEKKPKYKKMGLVRTSYEVFKGKGEIVLYCEHLHSVLYKQPAKFKDKIKKK